MTTKRYSYRAYPNGTQARQLARVFGSCRVVYNDAIAYREAAHREGRRVTRGMVSRNLTESKRTPEREWLREVSSVALQQAIADADRAYANFFGSVAGRRKGSMVGHPRFRKKSSRQTARFTRNACFRVRETTHGVGFVRLPGVGELRFVLSRPLPSDSSSVTVTHESDGLYYVSFVVEVLAREPLPENNRAIGTDLGLTDLIAVATTDGTREKVGNPRFLRRAERRLVVAQRTLSRKRKGSANRTKARLVVAKRHSKVCRARLDHHHKLTHEIVHENQVIIVESLAVAVMIRGFLGKSVSDAGWGLLRKLLEEKALELGREVISIDRFEPTSQVCSVCGVKDGKKDLSVREWTCVSCGSPLDRDYNAALNILLAGGQSERLNACGPGVRLQLAGAVRDEAGTRRTDRVSSYASA